MRRRARTSLAATARATGLVLLAAGCFGSNAPPAASTQPASAATAEEAAATPATPPTPRPPENTVSDCTVRIEPGQDVQAALTAGAVVCLAPGEHSGPLEITAPVTLRGEPGAIVSGGGDGPVIRILAHQITVNLHNLTLTDGYAETGSGLFLDGYAEVVMEECSILNNRQSMGGGTGVYVGMGHLAARKTTFGPGDDLIISQIGRATLVDCTIEGDLKILEGAQVEAKGGKVEGSLTIRGTTSRKPTVVLDNVHTPKLENDPDLPGDLTQR